MPANFADRSFEFACDIVRLYKELPANVPHVIKTQLLKAATSTGANLEEARAASSRRDLKAKFTIALREAREALYWLRLLQATKLASEPLLRRRLLEAWELVAVLTSSVKKLKKERREG